MCLVSRKTVERRLTVLAEHGAVKNPAGQWAIPVEALIAVGLKPGRVSGGQSVGHSAPDGRHSPDKTGANGTPNELSDALRRLAVAEARLEERDRLLAERDRVVDALSRALRQLEAAPGPVQAAPSSPLPNEPAVTAVTAAVTASEPVAKPEAAAKPSRWRRLLGQ